MNYLFKNDDDNLDAITDLINRAYRSIEGAHRWTTENHLIGGDRISEMALRELVHDATMEFILMYEDNQLIGCISIKYFNGIAELGTFAIEPDYQGAAYGKHLFAYAEQHAATRCHILQVSVVSQNTSLIDFYRRRDYSELPGKLPFPVEEGVGQPIVANLDLTVMQKASLGL
jgi:N-acetylglutamate synthase-like GNAT family acetyltransferase